MSSEGILTNILRAMLFAGVCSVIFMILGMMGNYSIDSTDVQLATFQERISDAISANQYYTAINLDIAPLITSNDEFKHEDSFGIRVTFEDSDTPIYYNQKYFEANYGSGAGIKSNVRSRSAHRILKTTDGKSLYVTFDMVGSRI